MSENSYDLVVIGGGPGGYVAAIRAAQLGMTVACVEKRAALGGTCLNVGCIPSKALLRSSELFAEASHGFADHGIKAQVSLDLKALMGRKEKIVGDLTAGVAYLFKKNKVAHIEGTARIAAPGKVAVKSGKSEQTLAAGKIIIATGSDVSPLAGVEVDEKQIVSSTGALALKKVPKRLVVIGAGFIGLELGSVWRRLGSQVTVVEFLDRITPPLDLEIAKTLQRSLKKQGMTFKLGAKVTAAKALKNKVTLSLEPVKGGDAEKIDCDVVLVSVGRRPFTDGLGLDELGVARDAQGFIGIDGGFATNVDGVFAIGDVVRGPMLAHKAEEDGVACVETMAGQAGHVDYDLVPGVIYTSPQGAGVGQTEEALKEAGVDYSKGKFAFSANGYARCLGETDGFVKVLADAKTDRILGVHILGPDAGTLIHEAVAVMAFGGAAEDVARICHAHPTLAEALKEAALDAGGRVIHA
ncbi:MAG: dihydrolipoyl dehydrogenase [Alphaproteobacteria bacterium]|nr:dihydrolipoyl dehydrogenase [Alphaproteobacteria bacterium]